MRDPSPFLKSWGLISGGSRFSFWTANDNFFKYDFENFHQHNQNQNRTETKESASESTPQ